MSVLQSKHYTGSPRHLNKVQSPTMDSEALHDLFLPVSCSFYHFSLCSGQKASLLFFHLAHTLPPAALRLQGSLACHALQQLFSESPLKGQLLTPRLKYLPPCLLSPSLTSYIPLAYLSSLPHTREGSSADRGPALSPAAC